MFFVGCIYNIVFKLIIIGKMVILKIFDMCIFVGLLVLVIGVIGFIVLEVIK